MCRFRSKIDKSKFRKIEKRKLKKSKSGNFQNVEAEKEFRENLSGVALNPSVSAKLLLFMEQYGWLSKK
jgi:hypothetical protein